MVWWHSTPLHFSTHSFRWIIHGRSAQTHPLPVTPIPYRAYSSTPAFKTRTHRTSPINICGDFDVFAFARQPSPTYPIPVAGVMRVNGESSPTRRIMENDALFTNNSRKHQAQETRKTALAQISDTSRQQITNNSNSTNKSSQRLTADQFAMRKRLQRDCFPRLHLGANSLSDRA
ncbi:hypothetical protein AVEN_184216-1 [Araneus ventricosus]|uniref:Uncharacterized protein n=1 Tax=Araneus ventricosus TaxID=182803 RepID=A0A4Y2IC59_ARAVE|nr:hypothetical protein AVEN_184216-1 [Araneus ventricosus]